MKIQQKADVATISRIHWITNKENPYNPKKDYISSTFIASRKINLLMN